MTIINYLVKFPFFKKNISIQIVPKEYGIRIDDTKKSQIDLSMFGNVAEIYNEPLAPTSVCTGYHPFSNEVKFDEICSFWIE